MTPVVPYVRQALVLGLLVLATVSAAAQAPIGQPVNRFTPADEAQLEAEAADAVLDRLPPLNDADVKHFVAAIGGRLADAIPAELRQPAFRYEVGVLNIRGVTSFALPGGPVFISAKVIQLADNEDALAGLIAHELAHVVLRHATAQLSASEQYQIGAITGRQIGLTAASPMPGILEWGANFSIASYFLRFDPVYEAEADLLAARLAETAGYDPAAVNDMFRELTTAGAAHGGLTWLLRHPNRRTDDSERVVKAPSSELQAIQARIAAIPRRQQSIDNVQAADSPVATVGSHVPSPAVEVRSVTAGDQLQLSVPANWRHLLAGNTVIFAPEGAYVALRDGPAAMTHGFQVGVARSITGDVDGDMSTLLNALARNNPKLTWAPAFQRTRMARRDALTTTANHVSPVTRDFETVIVTALRLSDDSFLYFLGVAPQAEASTYRGAFDRVLQSVVVLE
jgi:Zn-dependent protease with chaperone function